MTVSYIDVNDYVNSPSGLEYSTLLGNSLRLNLAATIGATSLTVTPATTATLAPFDKITIYDGLNTEQVIVGAGGATIGSSSIPLQAPGCLYAHAQYTPLSSKGSLGDLGTEILKASAWVENITKQSLWSTTQTETLRIPSMRASFDNQSILTFRVKQYPITAVNTLQLGGSQGNFTSYDATQAFIDSNEVVTVPVLNATGGSSNWPLFPQQMDRTSNLYLQANYTAGFTSATMPSDVKDAAVLLTSVLLARRDNPAGMLDLREGAASITASIRGDISGDSILLKQAKFLLSNYTLRMF
jgi:hypothetical protein